MNIVFGLYMIEIKARFADRILLPDAALPPGVLEGATMVTTDGVNCVAHFLSTWNNKDGQYDEEFDNLCQRLWGCSFRLIRSAWIGRIGNIGQWWHLIELKRIDD